MRMMLAGVGIVLDDKKAPDQQVKPTSARPSGPSDEDRDMIRVILTDAGAPASDLEWLVASCPSVEDALTYHPARPVAYCASCQGPRVCDDGGCIVCRTVVRQA